MAKQIIVWDLVQKAYFIDQVWEVLLESYSNIGGGLLFVDKYALIHETSEWKITLSANNVASILIFKAKNGRKIVAMGINRRVNRARNLLITSLRQSLQYAWMEVSEMAETFVMKYCDGYKYLIHNSKASVLLGKKVKPAHDGYHYLRVVGDITKEKIIIGVPNTISFF